MGDASELIQTAPMTFTWKGMNSALICFTKNEDGKKVMMIEGNYFEQTSNAWALLSRIIIVLAILVAFSTIIAGMIAIIRAGAGKLAWRAVVPQVIPMIGVITLVCAVSKLLEVQQYSYKLSELGAINSTTLIIFLGTTVFALAAIGSLWYTMTSLRKTNKRWYSIYALLTSCSLCLIAIVLWQNGWIGLRTWAL